MDDFALVLNAGSSSLKFFVVRRSGAENWRLEARGQIEGIGTAPRLTAKDEAGTKLADQVLDDSVRDGRKALDALATWLRANYGGSRVLGVGHRVVHGGSKYAQPIIVDEKALQDIGIQPDESLPYVLSGITLRSALRIMLEPLGLTYVVDDEVLKITSKDAADEMLATRVYDVRPLAQAGLDSFQIADAITDTLRPGTWPARGPQTPPA